jgi:hypothetical protein
VGKAVHIGVSGLDGSRIVDLSHPGLYEPHRLAGDGVEGRVGLFVSQLEEENEDMFTVCGPADGHASVVAEPVEKVGPYPIKSGDVSVVDKQGRPVPKRMRVVVIGIAHRGASDVGQDGRAFRIESPLAVYGTFGRGRHLPEAARGAVGHVSQAPPMWIGEAAGVLAALVDEGILSVQQFAGRARGMGGLEPIESTHGSVQK